VTRVGNADVQVAVDISDAAGEVVDPPAGVRQLALETGERPDAGIVTGERLPSKRVRQQIAAYPQVIVFRIGAVGVGDEMAAERHVDADIARPFVRRRSVICQRFYRETVGRYAARNARIDHIDDPADRRGTEQQGARSAQHFDALRSQRIDRHGMVGIGRG